ncbi:DinB family protein [Flavobacterium sp. DGU38]|uniref:DinB family protein n=1 Tax=Flavobacterium calami TaxID=3139144 RepID=A0ABU9IML6_9FLAO
MLASDLSTNEYSVFNATYIKAANDKTLSDGLKEGLLQLVDFVKNIPAEKLEYRYAEGKWTIKDIILHMTDTERIFAYRALRISRGDKTPLPGFDENDYVPFAFANSRSIESLLTEYENTRKSTISFFESLNEQQFLFMGTASNTAISVRAIGFIITGHQNHHIRVISERYL